MIYGLLIDFFFGAKHEKCILIEMSICYIYKKDNKKSISQTLLKQKNMQPNGVKTIESSEKKGFDVEMQFTKPKINSSLSLQTIECNGERMR